MPQNGLFFFLICGPAPRHENSPAGGNKIKLKKRVRQVRFDVRIAGAHEPERARGFHGFRIYTGFIARILPRSGCARRRPIRVPAGPAAAGAAAAARAAAARSFPAELADFAGNLARFSVI